MARTIAPKARAASAAATCAAAIELIGIGSHSRDAIEDGAQKGDIVGIGARAGIGQADPGALLLAVEIPFDLDVAGALERADMRAEIALRGIDNRPQAHEFEPL